jgi:hypothetical protein
MFMGRQFDSEDDQGQLAIRNDNTQRLWLFDGGWIIAMSNALRFHSGACRHICPSLVYQRTESSANPPLVSVVVSCYSERSLSV